MRESSLFSFQRIRKTLVRADRPVLEVNIEYPIFNIEPPIEKINEFYRNLAENYAFYCENRFIKKITDTAVRSDNFKKFGEIMKFFIPYVDSEYLSVVCEIEHFNGFFKRKKRISQNWRVCDQIVLSSRFYSRVMGKTSKQIKREVGDMIVDSVKNGFCAFSYTERSIKKFAYKVNIDNFYLCDKGIAFWFDAGTLAPESEGFPTYIIKGGLKHNEPSFDGS